MKSQVKYVMASLALFVGLSTSAHAGTWQDYDEMAFQKAVKAGTPVVLDFKASWCSTCQKQERVTNELFESGDYDNFVGFRIDYDSAKALKKKYRVIKQSTLVLVKNGQEVGRSIGVVQSKALRKFFNQAN